jgi:hypothetical protein
MPYVINKTNGQPLLTLDDGVLDTTTSLSLVGRNFVGYGEIQNENFVHLLENFAGANPPSRPIAGQSWFNTQNNVLHVYDGTKWVVVGSAPLSDSPPEDPSIGSLWYKTPVGILYVYDGAEWAFVGPEKVEGYNTTAAKSQVLFDIFDNPQPVILITVNGTVLAIAASSAFSIGLQNEIPGFFELSPGINLSNSVVVKGNLVGKATSADKLETIRTINGIGFNGETDIVVKADTANKLIRGSYLTGIDFDGSEQVTWNVDATPSNIIGKVVARDASGSFSAGTITANIIGNLSGNVNAESGTSSFDVVTANTFIGANLTGNARTATRLQNAREINGVRFDGTENVTISADASTLTGSVLNSTVTLSNLTQVGILTSLTVNDAGISVGNGGQLRITSSGSTTNIKNAANNGSFEIEITDNAATNNSAKLSFIAASVSLSQSGDNNASLIPSEQFNLGHVNYQFDKIYASTVIANLQGNSNTATLASASTNIAGGSPGSIPFQTSSGSTSFLAAGIPGYFLKTMGPGTPPQWEQGVVQQPLQRGNFLTGDTYTGSNSTVWSVDATASNIGNKVVARDSSGNFSAGTVTASLNGNASTATRLQTPRTINGVSFDGTANINIPLSTGTDPTKVSKFGDSMSGYLTLVGAPVSSNHAATKAYVDSRASTFRFTYGNTQYATFGFSNIVGQWNFNTNYFDVFPPSGRSMANLVAFIPSIAVIHYAGDVNGDDSLVCTYTIFSNRIRVYVQNTEQRSTPAANWLAIWS